jgi:hypothetical protein
MDYNVYDRYGDVDEWFDDHDEAMQFYGSLRDECPTLTVVAYPVIINEHGRAITDAHNGVRIAGGDA